MQNYFIQVKWIDINDKKYTPWRFILNYHQVCWDGGKFGSPENELVWWPTFLFFFLKGKIIVYEIKQNCKIFNVRFFSIPFYSKNRIPILGKYSKYIIQYLVIAWETK